MLKIWYRRCLFKGGAFLLALRLTIPFSFFLTIEGLVSMGEVEIEIGGGVTEIGMVRGIMFPTVAEKIEYPSSSK